MIFIQLSTDALQEVEMIQSPRGPVQILKFADPATGIIFAIPRTSDQAANLRLALDGKQQIEIHQSL